MAKTETVYSLRYALTQGIILVEGEELSEGNFMVPQECYIVVLDGNDWTRDPDEAIRRACDMRDCQLVALKTQAVRLSKKVFTIPTETADA